MEDRIWYKFPNNKPYPYIEGVTVVTDSNSYQYIKEIKESIDMFHSVVKWDKMWDLEEAGKRFSKGGMLFLLRDIEGALGHTWFDHSYWYNIFIHPRRPPGTSLKFTYHCFNYNPYSELHGYTESWNIKAQKLFNIVGYKV